MARIRSLKPAFFTDADLTELPPLHRLAYQGLWCHADREGRLEDKPRELKVQILPFDECDFEAILRDLAEPRNGKAGRILRYEVNGRRYIWIPTFLEHQKPHFKESPSAIPAPTQPSASHNLGSGEPSASHNLGSGEPGGFLVLGSGSLVLGRGAVTSNSPDADAPAGAAAPRRPRRVTKEKPPPNPRHAPMVVRLSETYREVRNRPIDFTPRCANALSQLLPKADDAEIDRRWRIALAPGWPDCSYVYELKDKWEHYAQPKGPRQVADPLKAPVRAESQEHGTQLGLVEDF